MPDRPKPGKIRIKKVRNFHTYTAFWHTSWCLLEKGKESSEGSFHQYLASLVFSAFTIEAYLNHVGAWLFKSWREYERALNPMQKLALICERLDIKPNYGCPPFQILTTLLPFRNAVAHGKTETLTFDQVLPADEKSNEVLHAWIEADWERFATLENAEAARRDIRTLVELMHDRAKFPEHLNFPFMDDGQSMSGDYSCN